MKTIITIFAMTLGVTAFAQKTTIKPPTQSTLEQAVHKDTEGEVYYLKSEGCPLYLRVSEGEQMVKLFPIDLPARFQVHGMKLKFDYVDAKGTYPESCNFTKAISVSNVSEVKVPGVRE